MLKINVANPQLSSEERTYLDSDYSSGTNIIVRNNEGFTTSWFIIVGEPGQEQTESRQITSTSGGTIINFSSALTFSHPNSTPIYLSQWDKVSFERKASGGSYAEITDSPFAIGWDNSDNKTLIVSDPGETTDTFRWRFYNSALASYSTYSDGLSGAGYGRNTVGYVIEQVRKNPVTESISDETIMNYMNDYQQDLVYPEIPKAWWFEKEGTAVATTASTYRYNIETNWDDFISMKYLLYRYINGDTDITYPLTWSPTSEFYNLKSDANQSADNNVKYWTLLPADSSSSLGYIGLHPTPSSAVCYIKPVYYFELDVVDSFGDELVIPHPKGYVDYVLYRIYDDIKSSQSNADKYNARVRKDLVNLKSLAKRQRGQPELFRFRGQRGWSKQFGEQTRLSSSEARELYW